jgi:molecular chaperone GrpE (heat shock protein)
MPLLQWDGVQLYDLQDKVKRTMADMENLRERTARQAESSRQFAVQVRVVAALAFLPKRMVLLSISAY